MNSDPIDTHLREIEDRLDKATPGPWEVAGNSSSQMGILHVFDKPDAKGYPAEAVVLEGASYLDADDAAFIAAAPSDVRKLVKALRRAISGLEEAQENDALDEVQAILAQPGQTT